LKTLNVKHLAFSSYDPGSTGLYKNLIQLAEIYDIAVYTFELGMNPQNETRQLDDVIQELMESGINYIFDTKLGKAWRINKVLLGGNALRRTMIRAQDVLLPLGLFLSLSVAILAVWTAVAPLTWKEQLYKDGEQGLYRGTCYHLDRETDPKFEAKIAFASVLVAINIVALFITNYHYKLPVLASEKASQSV
jgi:hypothetical protein